MLGQFCSMSSFDFETTSEKAYWKLCVFWVHVTPAKTTVTNLVGVHKNISFLPTFCFNCRTTLSQLRCMWRHSSSFFLYSRLGTRFGELVSCWRIWSSWYWWRFSPRINFVYIRQLSYLGRIELSSHIWGLCLLEQYYVLKHVNCFQICWWWCLKLQRKQPGLCGEHWRPPNSAWREL